MSIKVLNLVTTRRPFFDSQVQILETKGIKQRTITVPSRYDPANNDSRTIVDYIKFYPIVLKESLKTYDIIHANTGRTAPHALCQPSLPVVVSFWGVDVVSDVYKQAWLSKICAKCADEVIVMSDHMAAELGVSAHVIPHGVNLDLFKPIKEDTALETVGWDKSQKHVLFPYSPDRKGKNFELAKEIVQKADAELEVDIQLQAVYGVEHKEIPMYMNASDLLLLTSNYEGSPNSVKEAMACNLPVVATNVGDVAERLSGVTHSYVCASEAELVERLIDVLKAGERSDGREHVQELSLERMGERIIEVYEQALTSY